MADPLHTPGEPEPPAPETPLDAGSQALAEALHTSFGIVKVFERLPCESRQQIGKSAFDAGHPQYSGFVNVGFGGGGGGSSAPVTQTKSS